MEVHEQKLELKKDFKLKTNSETNAKSAENTLYNKSVFYATGKRKTSVARVWLKKGQGEFIVNKKKLSQYFVREHYVAQILKPLNLLNVSDSFYLHCTVKGGGLTGQAGSIFHGVSKALSNASDSFHKILANQKFLTRDSRIVERKKYGKHKARKSTQFSKR